MSDPVHLYDVTVWLETDRDPAAAAEALVDALGGAAAMAATAGTVGHTEHGVSVRFPEVKAQVPPAGSEYSPPRDDAAGEGPARRALGSMEEMTDILPVVRSLITLSAARVRAGLAPSQRIVIDVHPSPVHSQDELRHS